MYSHSPRSWSGPPCWSPSPPPSPLPSQPASCSSSRSHRQSTKQLLHRSSKKSQQRSSKKLSHRYSKHLSRRSCKKSFYMSSEQSLHMPSEQSLHMSFKHSSHRSSKQSLHRSTKESSHRSTKESSHQSTKESSHQSTKESSHRLPNQSFHRSNHRLSSRYKIHKRDKRKGLGSACNKKARKPKKKVTLQSDGGVERELIGSPISDEELDSTYDMEPQTPNPNNKDNLDSERFWSGDLIGHTGSGCSLGEASAEAKCGTSGGDYGRDIDFGSPISDEDLDSSCDMESSKPNNKVNMLSEVGGKAELMGCTASGGSPGEAPSTETKSYFNLEDFQRKIVFVKAHHDFDWPFCRHKPNQKGKVGEWVRHTSSSGKEYYFNVNSHASQWEKPKEWLEHEKRHGIVPSNNVGFNPKPHPLSTESLIKPEFQQILQRVLGSSTTTTTNQEMTNSNSTHTPDKNHHNSLTLASSSNYHPPRLPNREQWLADHRFQASSSSNSNTAANFNQSSNNVQVHSSTSHHGTTPNASASTNFSTSSTQRLQQHDGNQQQQQYNRHSVSSSVSTSEQGSNSNSGNYHANSSHRPNQENSRHSTPAGARDSRKPSEDCMSQHKVARTNLSLRHHNNTLSRRIMTKTKSKMRRGQSNNIKHSKHSSKSNHLQSEDMDISPLDGNSPHNSHDSNKPSNSRPSTRDKNDRSTNHIHEGSNSYSRINNYRERYNRERGENRESPRNNRDSHNRSRQRERSSREVRTERERSRSKLRDERSGSPWDNDHTPERRDADSETSSIGPLGSLSAVNANNDSEIPSIPASLALYYRDDLIDHVRNLPGEALERQANKPNDDHLTQAAVSLSRVTTELKMARSIVRLTDIQITLREQRILFVRQQLKNLEQLDNSALLGLGNDE